MAVQFPEDLIGIASLSGCKLILVNEFQVSVFDLTDTDRTFRAADVKSDIIHGFQFLSSVQNPSISSISAASMADLYAL